VTAIQKFRTIKLSFGKGQFHFVEEKAMNAEYYVNKILDTAESD